MSNISGPHFPKDPYKDIKVHRIEEQKIEKEPYQELPIPRSSKKNAFFAAFLLLLKKAFSFLFPQTANKTTFYLQMEIESIQALVSYLEKMKQNDLSQDLPFLNQLCLVWHKFLDTTIKCKKITSYYAKIEELVAAFYHSATEKEHTLGHYLTEYAGSEWLPFPFLQLIQDLYQEYLRDPSTSRLEAWTKLLCKLIECLEKEAFTK